jgi:aminopeptidase N
MNFVRCLVLVCISISPAQAEAPFSFEKTPGRLPKEVVPLRYAVRIEPDIESATSRGSAEIDVEIRKPVEAIVLHALGLEVPRAELRGDSGTEPLATGIDPAAQTLTLRPARTLAPGRYRVALDFSGKLSEQPQGLFITRYKAGAGEKRALATHMEPADARRMFPCWDEPAFRAVFQLTAVVPEKHLAISNMPAVREQPRGDGKKEVHFAPTPSMSSYLVALAVGEFEVLEDTIEDVRLRIITTEGKREHGRYAMDATKKLLPYLNDYFGTRYPLPQLDQFCFPGFPAGGMENWGAIFYNDTTLLVDEAAASQANRERVFSVVAHELAHQWFGNLVTMGWWDNLWLNEGFASWMGTKATDHFNPGWQMWLRASGEKEWAMTLDARATTHPIQQPVPDEHAASDAFDEITYSKGQAVLRMLETWLGEEAFRAGIRSYLRQHAYGNTTTADLWQALEAASGKAVRDFAAGWTEQPGFPVVRVMEDGVGGPLMLQQERFTIHQRNAPPLSWKVPVQMASLAAMSDPQTVLLDEKPVAIPGAGPEMPWKLNTGASGYFRADHGVWFSTLRAAAPSLPEADRLNLLHDAWALVQAGRLAVAQYFDLIAALAPEEKSHAIWDDIIDQLSFIDHLQRGAPGREKFRAWARALLRPQLVRLGWDAAPGEHALAPRLRAAVIRAMGTWGEEEVQREARSRFEKFRREPASLPGDLRGAVFSLVGRDADRATYELLHALAKAEPSTEQRRNLYTALAAARLPDLAGRTLALAITDELLPNDATALVGRVAHSGEHPELAWGFAQQNLDALLSKLASIRANDYVPGIMRAFADAARADELERFASRNLPPQAGVSVAKAADDIRFKAELKARVLPETDAWIASRAP